MAMRAKWQPFCRWQFQMHFLEIKFSNLDPYCTEMCSWTLNKMSALVWCLFSTKPLLVPEPTHFRHQASMIEYRCDTIFSPPYILTPGWKYRYDIFTRARINSWIELELIINSIQFSMNWIGIELKDSELELNWNWKPELIGIDQFNQFIFNSTPHFTWLSTFFICHIMEIVVWQAIPCKQAYPHAPLCVPSMGSAGVFGHKGITITSITLRYFQCFNSLVMKSFFVTQKDHQLISPL